MNRKPTMNDVARVAGVGRGTVSNYINGRKIKEENRQKVELLIKTVFNFSKSSNVFSVPFTTQSKGSSAT